MQVLVERVNIKSKGKLKKISGNQRNQREKQRYKIILR